MKEQIEELKKLSEKADDGPLLFLDFGNGAWEIQRQCDHGVICFRPPWETNASASGANGELIVALRNHALPIIRELVEREKKLREALEQVRAELRKPCTAVIGDANRSSLAEKALSETREEWELFEGYIYVGGICFGAADDYPNLAAWLKENK